MNVAHCNGALRDLNYLDLLEWMISIERLLAAALATYSEGKLTDAD